MTNKQSYLNRVRHSIGTKIIFPYLLLTLVIAGIGTFLLTTFITDTVNERLTNQLVDAGRVVSERMVNFEEDRLDTLRLVAGTLGVPESITNGDAETLERLVLPVAINNGVDAVELIDMSGTEVFGWQRIPGLPLEEALKRSGSDFSDTPDVQLVLSGEVDASGDKRVYLSNTPQGAMLFTVGPVLDENDQQIGAVLIGNYLNLLTIRLTESAVARVTFYDKNGMVIETTLGSTDELTPLTDAADLETIRSQLQLSPERVQVVRTQIAEEVPIVDVSVLDQDYSLAYGPWRLRGQTFGLFSVALPTNFLTTVQDTGRNSFYTLFTIATIVVLAAGFFITRRITNPLTKLVDTATAVGEGDLEQRTGLESPDEIGQLATSFDLMTTRLSQRTTQLIKRSTELETILNSIGDGVILLDDEDNIVTANTAAQRLLSDLSYDFFTSGPFRELKLEPADSSPTTLADKTMPNLTAQADTSHPPLLKRYQIGNRTLTTLASEVETPEGVHLGSVIVLRDITREIEADNLKDAFITSISHELRTPLTVIKVYADLLQKSGNGQLTDRQIQFLRNIERSSQQLENHISQLINISEIQAGTIHINLQPQDFVGLVQQAITNWQHRIESKGLHLNVHLPAEPLLVLADTVQLGWAVESLLSNAHNYTMSGGQITVTVDNYNENARLQVQDTGIGIAAVDQGQLFNQFFRAQNSVNFEIRGVGLGLFIARSVVETHHGHVEVISELGRGSTFTVELPLAES
ncbi:MAG: ATP-binding protein [Chloroflexota bacterium]